MKKVHIGPVFCRTVHGPSGPSGSPVLRILLFRIIWLSGIRYLLMVKEQTISVMLKAARDSTRDKSGQLIWSFYILMNINLRFIVK